MGGIRVNGLKIAFKNFENFEKKSGGCLPPVVQPEKEQRGSLVVEKWWFSDRQDDVCRIYP